VDDDDERGDLSFAPVQRVYLRIASDDPRWAMDPPYNWRPLTAKFKGFCWYCGQRVEEGSYALYSPVLKLLAHPTCRAGED